MKQVHINGLLPKIFVCFFAVAAIYSCKKDAAKTPKNRKLIQAQWNLLSITERDGNSNAVLQYEGAESDYIKFRKDSIFTFINNKHEDGRYRFINDSTVAIFKRTPKIDTIFISTLNNNWLVFQNPAGNGKVMIDSLRK